jgi:hypothetical protein
MEWTVVLNALVFGLPFLAFAYLLLYTLVGPALHLLAVVLRGIAGQKLGVDWWILGRILPLMLCLAVLALLGFLAQDWSPEGQFALGQFGAMALAIAAVMIPVGLPLVHAYGKTEPPGKLYLLALVSFLAMPVAAAITTGVIFESSASLAARTDEGARAFAGLPQVFEIQSRLSPCTGAITRFFPDGLVVERPGAVSGPLLDKGVYYYWIDQTLKAAFLDFFEAFDCGTTNLHHNTAHPMMSGFVFLYRAFVQLIVFAVIAYPFTRRTA